MSDSSVIKEVQDKDGKDNKSGGEMGSDRVMASEEEEVVQFMEQAHLLRDSNKALRTWVMGLFVMVVVLSVSNMVTAFVAARSAKNTDVDATTGVMSVKGHRETPVVTVASGTSSSIDLLWDEAAGTHKFCTPVTTLATYWNDTFRGTPTNLEFRMAHEIEDGRTVKTSFGVSLQTSGTIQNETHVCFPQPGTCSASSEEKEEMFTCFDFTDSFCDSQDDRRRLEGYEWTHHDRRELFQAAVNGRLDDKWNDKDFDPLGVLQENENSFDDRHLALRDRLRDYAVKYGRPSMLAVVGYLVRLGRGIRFPGGGGGGDNNV